MATTEPATPLTSSENEALNMAEVSLGPTNLLNAPGFEPTAPGTGVSGALSSARTSFTRVGLDDEAPASHDRPSTSLSEAPRVPANEAIDNPTSTSTAAILPIEPSMRVEQPPTIAQEVLVPQTPQTFITFLLISGRRRTMSFEPETTIGRVKELVWNGWPGDWQDERPPAPSYLRILYLGKMLQDDDTLPQTANTHAAVNIKRLWLNNASTDSYHSPSLNPTLRSSWGRRRPQKEETGEGRRTTRLRA
ncbi:uncharacterized protein LACBIDRAFT_294595 [Laccaria bicolor S238N-H82]|uniref:Predicted protein n=1 Tax=Laccaria bicolor (strain S238N-H82 / ATCC MYA-4686) TaxID=486041 RepID=B0DEZ7_LACBS|nr:uncharacterized protein LACBIDRAFT_294595 [Laccaria bicolor S238N-H82]EDR06633.1 predicted protein [Laccaria bicolor S238N-H82]|eukprot:XP_001882480.1 predicted protein [Laccaria bicolor S238N-H82]